ncbi:uncharacterized protein LOC135386987 isoform X2 [Ornithodoros turicata]|uniref:uncharacterized protein LOC135386987 isoform X2 n=1 Tax=Ornithodoros turicata TaxID=34597 RepID=UPI00313A170A
MEDSSQGLTVGEWTFPHPSTIPDSEWKDDMKMWPPLQENHITYYLLKTKACDLEDVQALKSLEAYNYLVPSFGRWSSRIATASQAKCVQTLVQHGIKAPKGTWCLVSYRT